MSHETFHNRGNFVSFLKKASLEQPPKSSLHYLLIWYGGVSAGKAAVWMSSAGALTTLVLACDGLAEVKGIPRIFPAEETSFPNHGSRYKDNVFMDSFSTSTVTSGVGLVVCEPHLCPPNTHSHQLVRVITNNYDVQSSQSYWVLE